MTPNQIPLPWYNNPLAFSHSLVRRDDVRGYSLPRKGQGYRMFKSISTRKLSSQAARLSLPRNEVFVSG